MKSALCAAAVASVLGSLPVAAAQRPVTVAVERCPALPETALRALMRAELGGLLVDAGDGVERVLVSCDGELARVTVASAGGPPLARSLSLAGFPADARPRLLALVAVELLAAERPEIRRRLETRETPVLARAEPPPVAPRSVRLLAGGGGRVFLAAQGLAAWTGGVRVETALGPRLELALDAELGGARRALGLGRIDGWLGSGATALRLRREGGAAWSVAGGLGARFGAVRLAGAPARSDQASGRTVLRPWGGPIATAALGLRRGHLGAALGLEVGYAAASARGFAGDALAVALSGPWVGVTLSGGWQR